MDLLGPLLEKLSRYLKRNPETQPGLFHQVNENYFKRIEAIEFTVKHDDGKYADSLDRADIILVGLSRTSKTPLSVYLSYKGWKVANVPLVKDIDPPAELFQTDQRKIIGLVIDPETLVKIRRERLVKMGDNPSADYANLNHVIAEIDFCKDLFRRNRRWPVFGFRFQNVRQIRVTDIVITVYLCHPVVKDPRTPTEPSRALFLESSFFGLIKVG